MEYTVGVAIQGILGVFGFGPSPAGILTTWYSGALVSRPVPSLEGYDPDTGQVTPGRITLEFNGRPELRNALLAQATRPASRLAAPVDASDGVITLNSPLSPAPQIGQRLYFRNETLLVGGVSGADITVLRGTFGSRARSWSAGAFVWTSPPYWRRRYVEVREYTRDDITGAGVVRWRGFLDREPYTSADGSRIIVEASGPLALDADLRLNRSAPVGRLLRPKTVTGLGVSPGVHKGAPSTSRQVALQVGPSLATARWDGAAYQIIANQRLASPPVPLLGELDAREVLCVARGAPQANPLLDAGLPYPLHPLTLAAALLFSTEDEAPDAARYDVLSPRWSCGLGAFLTDDSIAAITALIEHTRELEIDHVVYGWDGDAPVILPQLRALLLSFGFAIGLTPDGGLTFVQAGRAASYADELETLDPVKDLVSFEQSRGGANDNVSADLGRLPWQSPARLNMSVQADLTDYPVEGETVNVDMGSRALWRADELARGELLALAYRRQLGAPMLRLRLRGAIAPGCGTRYRLAQINGLVTPIFRTPDDEDTADLSLDVFTVEVNHRRWLVNERSWEITAQLTAWPLGGLLRLRAPSATVASVSGPAYTVGGDYGQLGEAAATFELGQRVSAWSPDGERISDDQEIAGIAGAVLTLNSPLSPTPPAGSILRLCDLSEQALDPRKWVWLGAADLYA